MSDFQIPKPDFQAPVIKDRLAEVKPARLEPAPSASQSKGPGFAEMLENAIDQVNEIQKKAGDESQKLVTGEIKDIHTAMIAAQKADISFQMMMQVRNKLVTAYQEIMRMPV